jgi:hypothetical protein
MAEQRLHSALAPVDILTRLELEQVQRKGMEEFFHQEYLGVDYKEYNDNAQGATTYAFPGPDSGYAWSLKLISAVMATGTFAAYLGDNTNTAPIAYSASGANPVFTFTSNVVVVKDNRVITLVASVALGAVKLLAKQVPAEMVAKL